MHGRVKKDEQAKEAQKTREEKQEELRKVHVYHEIADKVIALKNEKRLEESSLALTSHLLLLNPDFQMIWSYRREILLHLVESDSSDMDKLAETEFKLTFDAIHRHPKSYPTWFHRQWLVNQLGWGDYEKEIKLCNRLLELDERNYHCWNYRRRICKLANVSREDDLAFTTHKIEQNFSNYAALTQRTLCLPDPLTSDVIFEEIAFIQQAVFTEPDDQSGWFYYNYLVDSMLEIVRSSGDDSTEKAFLESQIEWLEELLEMETEAKWVVLALAKSYAGLIEADASHHVDAREKCQELYAKACELDPRHANYYRRMRSKYVAEDTS